MAHIMVLPKIGVNMVEASISEWSAKVGEEVKEGDVIAAIETDKATQEIYAPMSGTILAHLVELGTVIPCQEPILIIGEKGEDVSSLIPKAGGAGSSYKAAPAAPASASQAAPVPVALAPASKVYQSPLLPSPLISNGSRIRISPLAKKTAHQHGVDPGSLTPSVPGGRITHKDVLRFLGGTPTKASAPTAITEEAGDIRIPLTMVKKTIISRMSQSNQTIPRAILNLRVDATEILKWKAAAAEQGLKIGVTEITVKALGKALREHPLLNSRLEPDAIVASSRVNIGVAVDSDRGLLVPVIKDADKLGLGEISSRLRNLAAKGRAGSLSMDEMSGGTFTVTNLGMIGIEHFVPVINPPECAILAVGSVIREAVVDPKDDSIAVKPLFWLSLAFDHRVVDGAPAGRFLSYLKKLLEWPLSMIQ